MHELPMAIRPMSMEMSVCLDAEDLDVEDLDVGDHGTAFADARYTIRLLCL